MFLQKCLPFLCKDEALNRHLMSYRCAIREVRGGIDAAVRDKTLKMPPCDIRDPQRRSPGLARIHSSISSRHFGGAQSQRVADVQRCQKNALEWSAQARFSSPDPGHAS
jgi:hypothetical protein